MRTQFLVTVRETDDVHISDLRSFVGRAITEQQKELSAEDPIYDIPSSGISVDFFHESEWVEAHEARRLERQLEELEHGKLIASKIEIKNATFSAGAAKSIFIFYFFVFIVIWFGIHLIEKAFRYFVGA